MSEKETNSKLKARAVQRLNALVQTKGWSATALAKRLGLSHAREVWRRIRGDRDLTLKHAKAILALARKDPGHASSD